MRFSMSRKNFTETQNIFAMDSNLLDKFILSLKNNDEASKKMSDLIKRSSQLFSNFLAMSASNQKAKDFFDELLEKNNVLISKNISDVGSLWGPTDLSFKRVYKFVRCVVGIDVNGGRHEIGLDYTSRHHNDATAEIGIRTGCTIKDPTDTSFILGQEVSSQGTLIIQIEGANMFAYLPQSISRAQYIDINNFLDACKGFEEIVIIHDDKFYDDASLKITTNTLKQFCSRIIPKTSELNPNELGKQNSQ